MGAPTLSDMAKRKSPALSWKYDVTMPDLLGPALGSASSKRSGLISEYSSITGSQAKTSLRGEHIVENIAFPHSGAPAIARFNAASNVYYPNFNDIASTDIEFYEDYTYSTTNYLLAWRHLVFNSKSGAYRESAIYKMNIHLRAYSGVDNNKPNFQGTLEGCWPTNVNPFMYSSDNNRLIVSCNFSVDSNSIRI